MAVSASITSQAPPPVGGVLAGKAAVPLVMVAAPVVSGAQAAQGSPGVGAEPPKLTLEQVKSSLHEFQQAVQKAAPGLQLSVDEELGVTVVKFVDTETQEVLRQFPSEEMLHIAKSVIKMQGLLVSKVA